MPIVNKPFKLRTEEELIENLHKVYKAYNYKDIVSSYGVTNTGPSYFIREGSSSPSYFVRVVVGSGGSSSSRWGF